MSIELKDKNNAHLEDSAQLIARIDQLGEGIKKVRESIGRVIFGQTEVVEETLITIFAGGHMLLIGVPGLGKTRLVETLGTVLGLNDKRVQFTPDLMPGDILESEVLEESESGRRSFRFVQGPVFCQLLMADMGDPLGPWFTLHMVRATQEQRSAQGWLLYQRREMLRICGTTL